MDEKERARSERAQPAADTGDAGEGLDAARANAEQLLSAADDAIARALSRDSERFLQATRQSSGQ